MDLLQRVEELNKKGKALNDQRTRDMGRRDELQKRLNKALEEYNAKYGTTLTPDTLQAEYERVSKDVEVKTTQLEGIITAIESGDYKTAETLSGGYEVLSDVTQGVTETPVPQPVAEPQSVPESTVLQSAPQGVAPQAPVPPVQTAQTAQPVPPVQPTQAAPQAPVPPVQPTQAAPEPPKDVFNRSFQQPASETKVADEFLEGVTPKPADTPVAPPSFEGVLNGSVFG